MSHTAEITDATIPRTPELEKWLEALRGGKYAQAYSRLRDNEGFCCLGVACDVLKDDVGGKWLKDNHFKVSLNQAATMGALPIKVRELLSLSCRQEDVLTDMNDTDRATFPEIADYLESIAV